MSRRRRSRSSAPAAPAVPDAPPVVALLLVALLAAGLYGGTLSHGYVLDDAMVITDNASTRAGLAGIPDLLTRESFHGYFGKSTAYVAGGRYRPLSLVTFAVEQELFGPDPRAGHAGNVILYAASAALLLALLWRLLPACPGRPWWGRTASLATLLFVAHPLHTEVVANVKGRDEILALLLSLLTLWLSFSALERGSRAARAGAGLAFLGALLAKESAITFLAVVPLSLACFRARPAREVLRATWPLLAAAAVFFFVRQVLVAMPTIQVTHELLNDPFLDAGVSERWGTRLLVLGLYLKLLVFPYPLTYDYGPYHIPLVGLGDPRALAAGIAYLGLAALALRRLARRDVLAWAILAYGLTLSVVSNFLVDVGTFAAERFLYVPSLAFCVGAAHLLVRGAERLRPGRAPVLATAVCVAAALVLGWRTVERNRVWKDDFTLTTHDVAVSRDSAKANASAADFLIVEARHSHDPATRDALYARAIAHLEHALEIHPRYVRALLILAEVHRERTGDAERAIELYERAFRLDPHHARLAATLGALWLQHRRDRPERAVYYLERAVAREPRDAALLENLGIAYYYRGDDARAVAMLEQALRLHPDDPELLRNLGLVLRSKGDTARAETLLQRATELGG